MKRISEHKLKEAWEAFNNGSMRKRWMAHQLMASLMMSQMGIDRPIIIARFADLGEALRLKMLRNTPRY